MPPKHGQPRAAAVSSGRGNERPSPPRLPPGPHVCLMMSIIPVLSLEEAEQLTGAKNSPETWAAGLPLQPGPETPGAYPSRRPSPAASLDLLPFTPRHTSSRKPSPRSGILTCGSNPVSAHKLGSAGQATARGQAAGEGRAQALAHPGLREHLLPLLGTKTLQPAFHGNRLLRPLWEVSTGLPGLLPTSAARPGLQGATHPGVHVLPSSPGLRPV